MTRKLGRFYLENGRFSFFAVVFCEVSLCTVFQPFRSGTCSVFNRFVPEIVPFSRKTYQICHCEEGASARRGNLKRCDLSSRNEIWLRGTKQNLGMNRTLKERKRKQNDAANSFFVLGLPFCVVLPCFATGCHAFGFKIATSLRSSQ